MAQLKKRIAFWDVDNNKKNTINLIFINKNLFFYTYFRSVLRSSFMSAEFLGWPVIRPLETQLAKSLPDVHHSMAV
jgi:hypothetical protein